MVESKVKKHLYFLAFIIPCLILYILFFLTPFFRGIAISLTNWDGLTPKTPIILEKNEFESKILSKIADSADREYVLGIYSLDSSDNSYKRIAVKGGQRRKLESIVRRTGYEPDRNKFVGLDNYKKIFMGQVDADFYPHRSSVEKYNKTSGLPSVISKREFEREILRGAKADSGNAALISGAYSYDGGVKGYRLSNSYDEFEAEDSVWDLDEVKTGAVSEKVLDAFVRAVKAAAVVQSRAETDAVCESFIAESGVSEVSAEVIRSAADKFFETGRLKAALSEAWVVKKNNMGVIGFTLFFAFFSVIGINVLAFVLALALDTGIRGQKILRTIFFLPNVLSMIIVALIWSMLFVQLLPAVTGIDKWLTDSAKTPWLLVLVAVWQGCGYYMIVYLAGLQNIPTDVIEAAKIDGASGWHRFVYITLPMMIPALTISLFLTIANALKSFDLIYAIIGSTGYATGTVPFVMDIYFDAFSQKQAGLATAKAMVLCLVIVAVTGLQLYTMKKKEVEA